MSGAIPESTPVIEVVDRPDRGHYEITFDGRPAGLSQYRLHGDRITFVHTEIDDAFEGHGLGGRLVKFALDDARSRGLGVVPRCPFVAAYIDQHPEYADLVVNR